MIELQNVEINEITLGTTPIVEITLGDIPVWPSNYTYTLTFKQVNYSSGSSIKANQTNYATFTCYYDKFNSSNVLVLRQEVTAAPSATAFKAYDSSLYFDDSYNTTQVNAGTKTATLSYGGKSTTGEFSFQGNYSHKYYANAVPDVSVFPANGGDSSVTDGYSYLHWDSGVDGSPSHLNWANYNHPSGNPILIIGAAHVLTVPSLGTHETSETTYTLSVQNDNSAPTVQITQQANVKTPIGSTTYQTINVDTSTDMNSYYQCAASFQGNLRVRIDKTSGGYSYSSGATTPGTTTTGITVTPTVQYQSTPFVSVSPSATSEVVIYIPKNTSGSSRNATITFADSNNTIVTGLYISQSGS